MDSKNVLKKIWSIASTIIVAIVVFIAVFLMGSRIIGFRVFTVISGSMEPTYSVGDLIYVKKANPNTVKVGDPITFVMNEELTVATHRVIKVDAENKHFYTQGDANDTPDASPVHYNNLIGKPVFSIPLLGYVSNWVQNPPGTYIAITIGVLLILAVFLPDFFKKKELEEDPEIAAESKEIAKEKAELEKMKEEIAAAKAELEAAENKKGEETPEE